MFADEALPDAPSQNADGTSAEGFVAYDAGRPDTLSPEDTVNVDIADGYPGVPAGNIAVASDGHYVDAGAPKYDLDDDGQAETAVVQEDDRVIQVSDTDGDGRADEMLQVDIVTQQAAVMTDDGSGNWALAATGHLNSDGRFEEDSALERGTAGSPASAHHPPGVTFTSVNGTRIDLGAPKEDLDGDGVAESVAVRTESGGILMLSDTNADGQPDQLIQVDPKTGAATWAVPDDHGGWQVVQTGHLQADGSLLIDDNPLMTAPPHENVEVAVGGNSFDAGPATIDTDGDGVPDTVAVPGPAGSTLFYQDADGDGTADRAWSTDSVGQVTANYTLSTSGNWVADAVAGER